MKILGLKVEIADNSWKKMKGLMFRKQLKHALLFKLDRETRVEASIHSFFVFFAFDIIWLNKNKKIIDMRKKVVPFTLSATPKKAAMYFIELPVGTIKNKKLRIGQKIKF